MNGTSPLDELLKGWDKLWQVYIPALSLLSLIYDVAHIRTNLKRIANTLEKRKEP